MPPVDEYTLEPPSVPLPVLRSRGFATGCLGSHSAADVGTSHWFPASVVFLTRMATCALLIFLAVTMLDNDTTNVFSLFMWTILSQASAFLLLAVCSLLAVAGRRARPLATITALHYQVAGTLSMFIIPIGIFFYVRLGVTKAWEILPPLSALIFDTFVMGARVQFRFRSVWAPLAVLAGYATLLLADLLGIQKAHLASREIAILVVVVAALALWAVLVTAILITAMRMPALVSSRISRISNEKNMAAMNTLPIASEV